jgi:putative oxidoreductase
VSADPSANEFVRLGDCDGQTTPGASPSDSPPASSDDVKRRRRRHRAVIPVDAGARPELALVFEEDVMDFAAFRTAATSYALALLRIMTGLLFFEHGSAKLLGFPSMPGGGQESHAMLMFTGTMELVGGALIVVGLFTTIAAFILSGYMAVGYFIAHAPHSFFPLVNHGEPAILYSFVFLFIAAAGPGAWAIDAVRSGPMARGRRGDWSPTTGS